MTKPYDYLVLIGRFQPFHKGHEFLVRQALQQAEKVIILIGSADRPRTLKNPFSFAERKSVITQVFGDDHTRIHCLPLCDTLYNDHLWICRVQEAVRTVAPAHARIGLIGHDKDSSSYYLRLFSQWENNWVESYDDLSATPIRQAYWTGEIWADKLPSATNKFLTTFQQSDDYQTLVRTYAHIKAYQDSFKALPYPPIFATTDALVVACGHILVIRRGGEYGKGLLALAGGFLDKDETLSECVVRELTEETGLDVSHLRPIQARTFDSPDRSARGRTITTVYQYELDALMPLKAGDDASEAFWLPLSDVRSELFFEDHYDIIVAMLGLG